MDKLKIILKMRDFKCSPLELEQRLTELEREYIIQKDIANYRINNSKSIEHIIRIQEYVSDMEKVMELVLKLKNNSKVKWKFIKVLLPFHIRKYKQILSLLKKMNKKYKKEDCDINNFEW